MQRLFDASMAGHTDAVVSQLTQRLKEAQEAAADAMLAQTRLVSALSPSSLWFALFRP
jgi:hypothetical protein